MLTGAVLLLLSSAALVVCTAALAAAPASVSVRVEGLSQTLVEPTTLTTTSTPVVKDANPADSCSATSATGALELATQGNWGGAWNKGLGYAVEAIDGESYAFDPSSNANYYWTYWLNNKSSESGICESELNPGDSVLFFVECYGRECPPPSNPLGISAPASGEVNSPVGVTVTSYHNPDGASSPAVGATVRGGGAVATTNSSGQATLSFATAGRYTLHGTAAGSVRTESSICVHNGNDGTCGTQSPAGTVTTTTTSTTPQLYTGPFAVVAKPIGLTEHRVYAHGHGPRTLAGSVSAHAGLTSVSIELRRAYHGHCSAYDGTSERFSSARCGHGSFFKVSSSSSFSYLLPAALPPGRYVLDIQATDAQGNHTTLARGSTRTVFHVR
jgi:hypothetical protein